MSAGVNGDPGTDDDHGLQLQPTVSWPRVMTVGRQYLVEVDLDLVTEDGTPPVVWPFDHEEYAYTCLLNGGEDFGLWAVHDASVVVHRFGGSYGPAQFVVTAKASKATDGTPESRSLRLTILNPWGVRINTFELEVGVRLDDDGTSPEPTVDVPSPAPQNGTGPHLPNGHGVPIPPSPAPAPNLDDQGSLTPHSRDRPSEPPTNSAVDPPPHRGDRPAAGALTEEYGLVALSRSRSGSLHFDRVPLFGPGARTGDTVSFTVRCLPSDDSGTAFATFAESPAAPYMPGPDSWSCSQGRFRPVPIGSTAELLHPYPGHVRLRGLPVTLRDDPRSWNEIMAAVPPRLPAGAGPAHLIAAVEISSEPAMVLKRIMRVGALFEHVAETSADPTSYSVITYGPHHINNNRDTYPEIPVRMLAWAVSVEPALHTLAGLAHHGALPNGYPHAAQLECMLAELANRLTWPRRPPCCYGRWLRRRTRRASIREPLHPVPRAPRRAAYSAARLKGRHPGRASARSATRT